MSINSALWAFFFSQSFIIYCSTDDKIIYQYKRWYHTSPLSHFSAICGCLFYFVSYSYSVMTVFLFSLLTDDMKNRSVWSKALAEILTTPAHHLWKWILEKPQQATLSRQVLIFQAHDTNNLYPWRNILNLLETVNLFFTHSISYLSCEWHNTLQPLKLSYWEPTNLEWTCELTRKIQHTHSRCKNMRVEFKLPKKYCKGKKTESWKK